VDTSSSSVPTISPQALWARMGRADSPLLLDVRREPAFRGSPELLAGAQRCAPDAVAALAAAQPPAEVIVYCVHGHQASADAAAVLREAGWDARRLEGGMEGGEDGVDSAVDIARWRAQRPLRIAKRPELGVTGERPSRWITRERPKIDRLACPWLVRRFIDSRAEFFYVPTPTVLDQAQRLKATAYDIPGAPLTHEGERCSFDAVLKEFGLREPALGALALIVRGADTGALQLAPESAGLLAFSLGLSRLHATDDHALLAAALPLYDALYAWCRQGQVERHEWNPLAITSTAR
jgi:rhodanese-related sulfurtransferase